MIELANFSTEFLILSMYSLCLGLAFYFVAQVSSRIKPFVNMWRDFWMVLIILCALPIVFIVLSFDNQELSVLDISQLQFTSSDSPTIKPLIATSNNLPSEMNLNIMGLASILWLCLYIVGFIYAIIRLVIQIRLIHTIIKNSDNIVDNKKLLGNRCYKYLVRIQKHTKTRVLISPLAISPFVYQWPKKYLVLPESLFNDPKISQQQIDLIIEHEMTHLRNQDQLLVLITHFIACVLWFNPFVKAFQKNMSWAIEAHCDSEVLIQKPHLRKIYAQTVLRILRGSATTTSNHMVAAFSTKTHRSLTMRITNIMKPTLTDVKLKTKKKKLWTVALSAGILMFITQPQTFAAPVTTQQVMVNPVMQAKVTSPYGAKNKIHKFHKGIDLGAKIDTPIVASSAGVVRASTDLLENKKNYGTLIVIDHADGFHSVYAHLNSRKVSAGDKVAAGELIGYVGETGKATGPHLHLELLKDNKHVNPSDYIKF